MEKIKVVIIGAGKVGSAFASDFKKKKVKVLGVIDRNKIRAKKVANLCGAKIFSTSLSDIPADANLFLISVQDRFIAEVAEKLSSLITDFKNKFAFHTSGALSSDELKSLQEKGCGVFSLHPNFSFITSDVKNQSLLRFNDCVLTLESNTRRGEIFGKNFCKKMGYKYVLIESSQKPLYHAFSVLISNYSIAQLYQIKKHLGTNFINSYLSLLKSTIQNVENFGVEKSLTGPLVRGDLITIKKNIQALKEKNPQLVNVYKTLGQLTLKLAKSSLEKGTLTKLKKLLS